MKKYFLVGAGAFLVMQVFVFGTLGSSAFVVQAASVGTTQKAVLKITASANGSTRSTTKTTNKNLSCVPQSAYVPANVDLAKVRAAWLSLYNGARAANGLAAYSYDPNLDRTATYWSNVSKQNGTITHSRPGQKVYYDYKRMVSWFKNLGLTFPNVKGKTFVENIGWDRYACSASDADCTDEMISSIKSTYNFFIGEKNKKYRAHYDSIMSPEFKKIGLGIAVDLTKKKYYLTVHYATAVDGHAKNSDGTVVECG